MLATCLMFAVSGNAPGGTMEENKLPSGAVDLGLPSGLKWASCNVGAKAPEGYGDYFAWGGTGLQSSYAWTTCPFRTDGDWDTTVQFSKYNTLSKHGPIDNKTVLDPEDDAARAKWGGSWRMPTDEEWIELRTECTWTWTTRNGINGRLVTGPNGNSIFLPAAGYRYNASHSSVGDFGNYWSSSLDANDPDSAFGADFGSGNVSKGYGNRYLGRSVRPVTE